MKITYKDKNGIEIKAGMTLRHDDGSTDVVCATTDSDGDEGLGFRCNAYGWGFCDGLSAAFREQAEQHQEWGLVMVVPQAVKKATEDMGKPSGYAEARTGGWRKRYAAAGYQDGKEFDPGHRLGEQAGQKKALN